MTLLTVIFPETKGPNPVAVKMGEDTWSLEAAWIVRVRVKGSCSAKVTVTRSVRLAPRVVGVVRGLLTVLSAVTVREAGRIVDGVMGMRDVNLPVPGSVSMVVVGISPVASRMVKTAVAAELANTSTNPVPTAGRL
jgi:hypothetical protein